MTVGQLIPTLEEQEHALKLYCQDVLVGEELGVRYYFLTNLRLPAKCIPATCDALLCSTTHASGYPSRLFFNQKITSPFDRNWNYTGRILEKNWQAFSFIVEPNGLSLGEILSAHLTGLVQST